MSDGWDGQERRAAVLADEQTKANGQLVEGPLIMFIVGFAAVILLELAALAGHLFLAGDQDSENDKAKAFRAQLSCFVVGINQGKQGTELLTDCGFLEVKGAD